MMWIALVAALAHAAPMGWRNDASGVYPGTTLPTNWSDSAAPAWSLKLPARSNASPVLLAGRVCVLSEPSIVVCADAATGAVSWQAKVEPVDALPPAEAAPLLGPLAAVPGKRKELTELQARYSEVRRSARAGGDVLAELDALVARMATLRRDIDALAPYLEPAGRDEIGWSSPTPITDGKHLFVYFGSGVVACFTAEGKRVWARWLGPHTSDLRGFTGTPAASPALHGSTLVVGYNTLMGLDASTGKTRWEVGPFEDFGAPAVADVGGVGVVFTASGRMVRVSDGKVLQEGLADAWYNGPFVAGSTVYFVGTTAEMPRGGWPTRAIAWDLARSGEAVVATRRFDVQLPTRERFYATPVLWRGKLYTVAIDGTVVELDPKTGATLRVATTPPPSSSEIWASPFVVGDRLRVFTSSGFLLTVGDDLKLSAPLRVEAGLGQPTFQGGRAYVRGVTRLWAIGG